ncbi:MAG: carboxypeptidase-like regulatory domain-containing protein [Dysgonamonadaceae bacterium]|jgi:hypothetical protein|nr:carboxypeptidase-like regulatory domain-containing protein [Dysgonamonadaceae bacterium]
MKFGITLLFFLSSIVLYAQDLPISGQIIDGTSTKPIPNASVSLSADGLNSLGGAICDSAGFFTIHNAKNGLSLIVSCVGYRTLTMKVKTVSGMQVYFL